MKEGTWVQSLSAESAPLTMQVCDGQVRFSQQSAAQAQLVMLVELGHLSIAQAQLVLERGLPLSQQALPMLSAASILLVRQIWFRNALLRWLQASTAATETEVGSALPGHSCDLAEATHQLTWIDQSQEIPLPGAGDWICASTLAVPIPSQINKWPSPPGRDCQQLLQSICRQSRSPIPLQQVLEISQGIDVLWACYQLSAVGVLKIGPNAAAVLELRGAAVSVDPAPSVAGVFSYRQAVRSAPDADSTEQALIAASQLSKAFGLGIGFDASQHPSDAGRELYRAALRLAPEKKGLCLQQLDNWWRQWC